jgi:hypothetical protein
MTQVRAATSRSEALALLSWQSAARHVTTRGMSARTRPKLRTWLVPCALALLPCSACQARATVRERELRTEVAALTRAPPAPVAPAPPPPSPSGCPEVERQARELGAALPRQLDADTRATRVSAQGCDLTLEYELVTLSAEDVADSGMRAMRSRVTDQLCADAGALAVMQRGGRFTNVYYDRVHAPIGLFTVAADDCGI